MIQCVGDHFFCRGGEGAAASVILGWGEGIVGSQLFHGGWGSWKQLHKTMCVGSSVRNTGPKLIISDTNGGPVAPYGAIVGPKDVYGLQEHF